MKGTLTTKTAQRLKEIEDCVKEYFAGERSGIINFKNELKEIIEKGDNIINLINEIEQVQNG